jgi:hypothetical protein
VEVKTVRGIGFRVHLYLVRIGTSMKDYLGTCLACGGMGEKTRWRGTRHMACLGSCVVFLSCLLVCLSGRALLLTT